MDILNLLPFPINHIIIKICTSMCACMCTAYIKQKKKKIHFLYITFYSSLFFIIFFFHFYALINVENICIFI